MTAIQRPPLPLTSVTSAPFGNVPSVVNPTKSAVRTSLPGLQVYGAYHLRAVYPGMHAVCLEPENFPDAPNHPNFPGSILRPGETHRSFMSFSFRA